MAEYVIQITTRDGHSMMLDFATLATATTAFQSLRYSAAVARLDMFQTITAGAISVKRFTRTAAGTIHQTETRNPV